MSNLLTQFNDPTLTPADYDFVARVISFIKHRQQLPINVQSEDVINKIQLESAWFYEWAEYATTEDALVFPVSVLNQPAEVYLKDNAVDPDDYFIPSNTVIMPQKCEEVFELVYDSTGYPSRTSFTFGKWYLENIFASSMGGMHGFAGADTYMASVFVANTIRSMSREAVAYEFNALTKELKVFDLGHRTGCILAKVMRRIPLTSLYKDDKYLRFISSKVLDAIADKQSLFNTGLPGDLSISPDVLRTRAKELFEYVNEQLKNDIDNDNYIIKS